MLRFKRRDAALGEGKVSKSFDRMKRIACGLLMAGVIFAAAEVAAAEVEPKAATKADVKPGAVEITVTPKDCRRLVAHKPADDVTYKPGVDAYGRPVAPADLAGTQVIKAPHNTNLR